MDVGAYKRCARGHIGDKGGVNDYRFKVSSTFKRCLQSQIDEGLRIKRKENDGCILLNGKNKLCTPKLVELSDRCETNIVEML
jgi:hypothetical protein